MLVRFLSYGLWFLLLKMAIPIPQGGVCFVCCECGIGWSRARTLSFLSASLAVESFQSCSREQLRWLLETE